MTTFDAPLTLSLLGATLLSRADSSGAPITALATGKPLALLTFLHCAPAHTASREQLLELLWSDADSDSARHTLRQTLWYIKRKLGVDPLVTTGDSLRLTLPLTSDRDQFLAALDADNPALAVTHYAGDFFPEFAAPGGAGFEHWADIERTRLRSLYIGAATRVVRDALGRGHARDAITVARKAQSLAPHHQATWRLLLESHLAANDVVGAAVELERMERWLADDELEPEPATAQLVKLVRSGKTNSNRGTTNAGDANGNDSTSAGASAHHALSAHTELVGREAEFAELVAAFEHVKQGHSRHLHISAPAGLGKTRLLDAFAARLRASRVRVVAVRANLGERQLPYAFAAQLVSALVQLRGASAVSPDAARTLVGLTPSASNYLSAEADASTGDDALRRRSLAVCELVTTVAHDAPLVLLVDDVHWMDGPSRTVLTALAARANGSPVLLVTAARDADAFIDSSPDAERLTLGPLSAEHIHALVTSIAQLPESSWSEGLITALHDASHGSPLMILEELHLAMERGHLVIANHVWHTPDVDALINTLAKGSASQQRLANLSEPARTALLRLAVVGTLANDAMVSDILDNDARQSLTVLESRGHIVRRTDGWQTAHDEIAALAMQSANTKDRSAAHNAVATHLERIADHDVALLQRAASHRAQGGDVLALDRTFARTVRIANATGNIGAIRQLGRDVLAAPHVNAEVEQLVRRLPWRVRHHTNVWIGGAIAGVVMLGAAMYATLRTAPVTIHEKLEATIIATDGEGPAFYSLSVQLDELKSTEPIELLATGSAFALSVLDSVKVMGRLNDGSFVGSSLLDNDATRGVDLVRVSADGDVFRLIGEGQEQRHDQDGSSVSPDGKTVAFFSGQWHQQQRNDIAVLDVASGRVTQVTNTDHHEYGPRWNADGNSLAFIRSWAIEHAAEVCWQPASATSATCRSLGDSLTPERIAAWSSTHSLLVSARRLRDNQSMLVEVDTAAGQQRVIDSAAARYDADPTGRVALCLCQVPGEKGQVFAVFSPSSPTVKRVVRRDGRPLRALYLQYIDWPRVETPLVSLSIVPRDTVFAGQRAQLSVRALDVDRQEVAVPRVRWLSLDTTIATIDSVGVATMRAAGSARFVAQSDSVKSPDVKSPEMTVPVVPPRHEMVIDERWTKPLATTWHVFGDPKPTLVREGGTSFLFADGDGHLTSGLISRTKFRVNNGAGLRAVVRLPIDTAQWQALTLALDFVATDVALKGWTDRGTGLFPHAWQAAQGDRYCAVRVPRAEGGENLSLVLFFVGAQEVPLRTQPRVIDGLPHTIDLQILGDGRCGLAIDGVVLAVSSHSIRTDKPLRVRIDGQSVGTKIRVGALEAWSGIRSGIDWNAMPGATKPLQ